MSEDKGKSCDFEDMGSKGYSSSTLSSIMTSTKGLARSTFTALNTYQLPRSFIGMSGLEKAQSSHSYPGYRLHSNHINLEDLSKIRQNSRFAGIRSAHNESCPVESEKEFANFLNDDCLFAVSQSSTNKNNIQKERPLFDGGLREIGIRHSLTIAEQESHDGEDVIKILSSPTSMRDELEELSEAENIFDSKSLFKKKNPASNAMSDHKFLSYEHPDQRYQSQFNFIPNFEDNSAHINQWIELQDTYTDRVWGNRLETTESTQKTQSMDKEKEKPSQMIAQRRLTAIWGHLNGRTLISPTSFLSQVQGRSKFFEAN